ncbi:acyl transferase/acyl hydrolase/lysophospholipase [Flagelloscypha sp. PMI_526]|nr:acyl transferase/acyl hydrolase/lysophospholipase [Flagelloscypha sp. PMI_526]
MSQIAALSLDGGGLLALSELYIIKDLLTRLQHDLDLPSEPLPCDIFDVIGGSGSGGVIAILLGRLHLSIDNAVNIFILIAKALRDELDQYQGFSKKLFRECPNNLLHSLLYLLRWLSGNVSTKKERSKRYQNNLKTHLGEQSNSGMREPNLRCKTFVCAMPRVVLAEGLPVCYRNYRSREDHTFDCSIWEAAYATTAYPKILGAIKIGEGMTSETIVDAGLGFSNPVEIVLDEIESLYSSSDSEICVLSLGVGHGGSSGRSSEDGSWESLLDDIARGCERTAQRFVKMKKKGYFRLNVQQGLQGIRLNDWTNPGDILTHTRSYLKDPEVKARQDQVVELLLRRYRERLIPSPTRRLNPRLAERMAKLRQIRSEDIHPKKEVLVAKGFRFQDVEVDLKPNQRFLVQHFTGSRARENRDRALQLNIQAMLTAGFWKIARLRQ